MSVRCANAASAARLFVQLSSARPSLLHPTAQQSGVLLLDVLLPPPTTTTTSTTITSTTTRAFHHIAPKTRPAAGGRRRPSTTRPSPLFPTPTTAAPAARRGFRATSAPQRTQSIHNAQRDEEGNEMLLEITPRAAHRLSQIMAKDENPHLALRISVESGGCHGFQYLMSLTTLPASLGGPSASDTTAAQTDDAPNPPPSPAVEADVVPSTTTSSAPAAQPGLGEDDTVLAYVKDDDVEGGGADVAAQPKVVLDGPSLDLLKGSKVDFTMELIGSQFKIVDNPLATSSCGCGTSFDIKP